MRKLIFRMGHADKQAVRRVLEGTRNGEAFEIESSPTAATLCLTCKDGDLLEDVRFYDEAENGSRSVVRTVMSSYKVGPEGPMAGGVCVYERSIEEQEKIAVEQPVVLPNEPEATVDVDAGETVVSTEGPAPEETGEELPVAEETNADGTPVAEAEVWIDEQLEPIVEVELVEEQTEVEVEPVEAEKPKTEAEHIREYLTANPDADNKDVIAALKEQGVNVSSSQVSRAKKQLLG